MEFSSAGDDLSIPVVQMVEVLTGNSPSYDIQPMDDGALIRHGDEDDVEYLADSRTSICDKNSDNGKESGSESESESNREMDEDMVTDVCGLAELTIKDPIDTTGAADGAGDATKYPSTVLHETAILESPEAVPLPVEWQPVPLPESAAQPFSE